MGLLTKEVKIKLHPSNISYFESLGYEIPRHYDERDKCYKVKRGTEITVRISDVKPNSMCEVEIECDCCHEILKRTYQSYNRYKKENGIYYCSSCYSKLFKSGENHPNWNPNLTDEERTIKRNYNDYDIFRKKVLSRDYYKCQCCGHESTDLEVHHLDSYDNNVEGRIDETNGITLCNNCHSNFHMIYGKGNNTKEQFEEWIGRTVELLKNNIEISPNRKVYCLDDDIVFDNTNDAAKYVNSNRRIIATCCSMKNYKLKNGQINRKKTVGGKHFLWYDEYIEMTDEKIKDYLLFCDNIQLDKEKISGKNHYRAKKVICTTTNEVFDTITDAVKKYPCTNTGNIALVCNGKRHYTGKLPDGTRLCWMYYKDYVEKYGEVS